MSLMFPVLRAPKHLPRFGGSVVRSYQTYWSVKVSSVNFALTDSKRFAWEFAGSEPFPTCTVILAFTVLSVARATDASRLSTTTISLCTRVRGRLILSSSMILGASLLGYDNPVLGA